METCWGDGGGHSSSQTDAPSQRRQPSKAQKSCPRPGAPRAPHRTAPRLRVPASPCASRTVARCRLWTGERSLGRTEREDGRDALEEPGLGEMRPAWGLRDAPGVVSKWCAIGYLSRVHLGPSPAGTRACPSSASAAVWPPAGHGPRWGSTCARSAEFRGLPPWFLGSTPCARPLDFSMWGSRQLKFGIVPHHVPAPGTVSFFSAWPGSWRPGRAVTVRPVPRENPGWPGRALAKWAETPQAPGRPSSPPAGAKRPWSKCMWVVRRSAPT